MIITEISTGGSVLELKLVNKPPDKVLVVDGEELMGAKQNRIVNVSFLIAAPFRNRYPRKLRGAGPVVLPEHHVFLRREGHAPESENGEAEKTAENRTRK